MALDQVLRMIFIVGVAIGVCFAYQKMTRHGFLSLMIFGGTSLLVAFGAASLACLGEYACDDVIMLRDDGYLGFGRAYVGGLGLFLGSMFCMIYRLLNRQINV